MARKAKAWLLILLSAAMLLSLFACKGKEEASNSATKGKETEAREETDNDSGEETLKDTENGSVSSSEMDSDSEKDTVSETENITDKDTESNSGNDFETEPEETREDAMVEIEKALSDYRLGEVQSLTSDGYIGIPAEISIYFDKKNSFKDGYSGTPIILYAVNTCMDRVGTESDESIIRSMLDRGYVVAVLDYLNNRAAVSPALDWSTQGIRSRLTSGEFFKNIDLFSTNGKYYESFVVPAGHNVSLNNVFWEFDKHSASGTLEEIVEVWNNDFRHAKGDKLIKWIDDAGQRKQVQNAFDGSSPVWCDKSGRANDAGEYILIKYTKAEKITDCVKADGTPIDLNLYMHLIYPTSPEEAVPVLCLASSNEHLANGSAVSDRPQLNGAAFGGYAAVMYDFGYTPMARDDHYSLFGSDITGDNLTYMVHFYNDKKINTAAMRYIRYLSLSDDRFSFDPDAIGVIGNSKGGWMTFLGEAHPELLVEQRIAPGCNGKSRFENGEVEDVGIIDGGEEQPWLTYNGKAIDSGADLIYASCGGAEEYITEGHAPTYVSCNKGDVSYYTSSNAYVNLCRIHNIPTMWFEVDKGHTFAWGKDSVYGIDTYAAFMDFAHFYLRGDAVKLLYTDVIDGGEEIASNKALFFMFSGAVSESEIAKLTPALADGRYAEGKWTSMYGGTWWTFEPYGFDGGERYYVTVPEDFAGVNGNKVGKKAVMSFTVAREETSEVNTVTTDKGIYVYFDANKADSNKIRVKVENSGANLLELYALEGFSASSPDSSSVGEKLGVAIVVDSGVVEFDVTDYCLGISEGKTVAFLLTQAREAGEYSIFESDFSNGTGNVGFYQSAEATEALDGSLAVRVNSSKLHTGYTNDDLYINMAKVASVGNLFGQVFTEVDEGRKFTVSIRVYDTVSRAMQIYIDSATSSAASVADYNWGALNFNTVAGEWVEVSFDYTVRFPAKTAPSLVLMSDFFGSEEHPFYIGKVECVESVSKLNISNIYLVSQNDAFADKEAEGEKAISVLRDGNTVGTFSSFADAMKSYKIGDVIKLMSNTDLDCGINQKVSIDLNGYKLYIKHSLNGDAEIANGYLFVGDVPLISDAGSYSFESVTLALDFNAKTSYFAADPDSGDVNATFTDCIFDINEWRAQDELTLFPASSSDAEISYRVLGGEFRFTSVGKMKISESIMGLILDKSGEEYPIVVLPIGLSAPKVTFRMGNEAGIYSSFTEKDGRAVYRLTADPLSSIYGTVPEEYTDVEKYPFALFDNKGNFILATDNF